MTIGTTYQGIGYEDYRLTNQIYGKETEDALSVDPDRQKKAGHRSSPEKCVMCKRRKYREG